MSAANISDIIFTLITVKPRMESERMQQLRHYHRLLEVNSSLTLTKFSYSEVNSET